MKLFAKLFAVVTLAVLSLSTLAADAVLDTGPGGIKVSFSISGMDGPFDYARNKGPKIATSNGFTAGEVA